MRAVLGASSRGQHRAASRSSPLPAFSGPGRDRGGGTSGPQRPSRVVAGSVVRQRWCCEPVRAAAAAAAAPRGGEGRGERACCRPTVPAGSPLSPVCKHFRCKVGALCRARGYPERWLVGLRRERLCRGRGRCSSRSLSAPGSVLCSFGVFPARALLSYPLCPASSPFPTPRPGPRSFNRRPLSVSHDSPCSSCGAQGQADPAPGLPSPAVGAGHLVTEQSQDTRCAASSAAGELHGLLLSLVTATTPCPFCTG